MLNNTFVCEQCSGLHRELTHRIKSISASRFTFPEIQALRNGGNQKAAAIWMAKWDEKKDKVPAVSDVILMRKYLRYKYVERRWMSDAHSHLYEPAPTARFLDSSSITTTTSSSSSSSSAMVLAKDSNATRHSSSTQNDMSIERLPSNSRSSHGNSNDTNTKAIAIRHLSPPDSNSHRKPGILQVNSPNSVTIFDRYNAASNDTDPYKSYLTRDRSHSDASTRRSGYSVGSQVDEDDIRNSPRTGGSGSGNNGRSQRSNELTVVTRNYLRDMKPITNELTSSPTSERDHTSRRDGSRRELDFFNNNINYDDEPIDEFFEIMRERVSEQRRTSSSETSSIRSGGNGGGSINNPFSKRQQQQQQQQQGNDGSSIPSASSSDTHASTTIPTPDGQLITFADSPQPIRPEIAKPWDMQRRHP
ncbi:hypothetical protein BDF22DRAFT_214725 [Syncephalis plumigaleata]|nr:hypothetical protein BDF22DRAFT_214725 [Syncephalis plumigaleata]